MKRKIGISLSERHYVVLKAAAEADEITVSEFIREIIRDLPEWITKKDWEADRDDSADSDFEDR